MYSPGPDNIKKHLTIHTRTRTLKLQMLLQWQLLRLKADRWDRKIALLLQTHPSTLSPLSSHLSHPPDTPYLPCLSSLSQLSSPDTSGQDVGADATAVSGLRQTQRATSARSQGLLSQIKVAERGTNLWIKTNQCFPPTEEPAKCGFCLHLLDESGVSRGSEEAKGSPVPGFDLGWGRCTWGGPLREGRDEMGLQF